MHYCQLIYFRIFKNMSSNKGNKPVYFLTVSTLLLQAAFKKIKVKLDLPNNINRLLMV